MRRPPQIPWQVTGNHWLSLPCVHPADGSLHAVGVLHRGSRAAVEFAGSADFESGTGASPKLSATSSRDISSRLLTSSWDRRGTRSRSRAADNRPASTIA